MPRGGSFPNWTYLHDRWDEALRDSRKNAEAMENDSWLQSLVRERIRGSTSLKWHLEADEPRDKTQKGAADLITRAIDRTPRLRRFIRHLARATWMGRHACQIEWKWQELSGQRCLTIGKHLPVNGDKLGWTLDHEPYVLVGGSDIGQLGKSEVIHTTRGRAVVLRGSWRERFVLHSAMPDDVDFFNSEQAGAIHGVGIRSKIYWSWFLRDEFLSWITDHLERVGLGLVVVFFEQGNPESQAAAERVARNYSRRAVITVPVPPGSMGGRIGGGGSAALQVIEAPTAGIEVLDGLRQRIEDQIERFIVGQSMSSGADNESGLGGTGRAQFAADTKRDIIVEDADELAETLTGTVEEPGLVSMIFRHSLPKLWGRFGLRWVFDLEETDPEKRLEAINKAYQVGCDFVKDEVRALTGMAKPQEGDDTISAQAQQQQQMQAQQQQQMQQAGQQHQQAMEQMAAQQQHEAQQADGQRQHEQAMKPPVPPEANEQATNGVVENGQSTNGVVGNGQAPTPAAPNGAPPWVPAGMGPRGGRIWRSGERTFHGRVPPGQSADSRAFLDYLARETGGNGEGAVSYGFDPNEPRDEGGGLFDAPPTGNGEESPT